MKFMKSLISLGLHKTPEVYLTGDFMKFMIFLKKNKKEHFMKSMKSLGSLYLKMIKKWRRKFPGLRQEFPG